MKQSITFSMFCDAFRSVDRNENFSYAGKRVLFDYLEEMGDSIGEDIDFDAIALCCEYSEDTASDIADNYNVEIPSDANHEDMMQIVRDYLQENTIVCGEHNNGVFVYVQF